MYRLLLSSSVQPPQWSTLKNLIWKIASFRHPKSKTNVTFPVIFVKRTTHILIIYSLYNVQNRFLYNFRMKFSVLDHCAAGRLHTSFWGSIDRSWLQDEWDSAPHLSKELENWYKTVRPTFFLTGGRKIPFH